jgi:hypothetical protein
MRPDGVRAAAQHALHRARWACDGADLHQSRLKKALIPHDDGHDERDGGHCQNCQSAALVSYPMAREEVEVELSGALFDGDPRGFIDHIGLRGRPLGNNRWAVWPTNDKAFISHRGLADQTQFANRFDHLNQVPVTGTHLADDPELLARFAELESQLADRLSGKADIAAVFYRIQTDVVKCTTSEELVTVVQQAYDQLGTVGVESTGELLFPDRTAHLVIATDLLIRRVRLPAIMFRFDQDPDALDTIANIGDEGGYFASSTDWFHGVIGASHYFGPLLGCMSPGFWCVPTGRPPTAILFSLGRGIAGQRHSPMEPMQLLPGLGRDEPVPDYELTSKSCRIAITWWTNRLNQMFGYLCDPTTFSNKHGIYDPYEHQHWLLTFGQVFGLTTALQASGRNHAVQRALMNTLLDTYADRITERRFDQLCTYDTAKATAERVRTKMPEDVAAILMPLADRAVDSLRRVQDGFFFRKQRGDNDVVVRIPGSNRGHHRQPQRAAAMLLKIYRNATHGFGGMRQPETEKDLVAERLLAHHTGDIPDDLVFLPYLYLLDTLCHPDKVRETIVKHALVRD